MTLATCGWGVWWVGVLLVRFWPDLSPGIVSGRALITALSVACALPGLLLALATVRARRSWLPFACVAIFANLSLLLLPLLLDGLSLPPRS